MTTIYGASDDLLEFGGDILGEVCYYDSSKEDPIVVHISDGTKFHAYYSEDGLWKIDILKKGSHFESLVKAVDPDSDKYSDKLTLLDGPLTAKYSTVGSNSWKKVR